MNEPIDGQAWYWLVFACPACGGRVRASTALRAWSRRPRVTFDDCEALFTKSKGPRNLENVRSNMWEHVRSLSRDERLRVARRFESFFASMERRLSEAAREARTAASRSRYL